MLQSCVVQTNLTKWSCVGVSYSIQSITISTLLLLLLLILLYAQYYQVIVTVMLDLLLTQFYMQNLLRYASHSFLMTPSSYNSTGSVDKLLALHYFFYNRCRWPKLVLKQLQAKILFSGSLLQSSILCIYRVIFFSAYNQSHYLVLTCCSNQFLLWLCQLLKQSSSRLSLLLSELFVTRPSLIFLFPNSLVKCSNMSIHYLLTYAQAWADLAGPLFDYQIIAMSIWRVVTLSIVIANYYNSGSL